MNNSLEMKQIAKLEQQITLQVNNFLVLSELGNPTQIALAYKSAQNEFLSLGPELHRISTKIGGELPNYVADFLESIDTVLHNEGIIDEETITHCLSTSAKLKAELKRI